MERECKIISIIKKKNDEKGLDVFTHHIGRGCASTATAHDSCLVE